MAADAMKAQLVRLFRAFYPGHLASRWESQLHSRPARWCKIDPWRTWTLERFGSAEMRALGESPASWLARPRIARHAQADVVVLRCGHSTPALETLTLAQALCGDRSLLEGFISIVPGRLGVVVNHDGDICILEKAGSCTFDPA